MVAIYSCGFPARLGTTLRYECGNGRTGSVILPEGPDAATVAQHAQYYRDLGYVVREPEVFGCCLACEGVGYRRGRGMRQIACKACKGVGTADCIAAEA